VIDWTKCPDVESVPDRCGGQWVVKDSRVIVESCILGNAEDCSAEEIADMFEVPGGVDVVRRIIRFARLAEAASLLQQAETIMHRLWEDESDRDELAPGILDFLDLLEQTANEIEQAAGTLAQITYQPDADEVGRPDQ
jgi:uncharacterized protein (DUF433 family)